MLDFWLVVVWLVFFSLSFLLFFRFSAVIQTFCCCRCFSFFLCLVHTFDIYATCFGVAIRQWPCDGTVARWDFYKVWSTTCKTISNNMFPCGYFAFCYSLSFHILPFSLSFCVDINVNHQCFALLLIRWTVFMTDRNGFTYTRNIISEPANSWNLRANALDFSLCVCVCWYPLRKG